MTLTVQPAISGAKGVDTIARITHEQAKALYAFGYTFAVRYLGHVTLAEVTDITQAGLGVLFIAGYSRAPGWVPTASMGALNGAQAIIDARKIGCIGASIYLDFEGPNSKSSKADCLLYANAAAHAIQQGGSPAGLYVGWGIPLDSVELYWALSFTGYWKSMSNVPDVGNRGYQMIQHSPANQVICGVTVDVDTIQTDHKGDVPQWLINVP
jgi:hypothetical protein